MAPTRCTGTASPKLILRDYAPAANSVPTEHVPAAGLRAEEVARTAPRHITERRGRCAPAVRPAIVKCPESSTNHVGRSPNQPYSGAST